MKGVLIDTQALIWYAEGSSELSVRARAMIDDASFVQLASVATLWEMAIKISIGKLQLSAGTLREFVTQLGANDIEVLPVSADDAVRVGDLPRGAHKDPFDRLIAAQALSRDLALVSIDVQFDTYGVRRVW